MSTNPTPGRIVRRALTLLLLGICAGAVTGCAMFHPVNSPGRYEQKREENRSAT